MRQIDLVYTDFVVFVKDEYLHKKMKAGFPTLFKIQITLLFLFYLFESFLGCLIFFRPIFSWNQDQSCFNAYLLSLQGL